MKRYKKTESRMKITKERLREIVKEVIKEESDYQKFFRKALEKSGKSLGDMTDQEKKDFFNKIDKSWKGKGEKNEGNAFGAAVTKAKEQGKDSFEVGGKTYKVKEDITISKDDMEKLHTDKEIEVDGEKITYDESVVNERKMNRTTAKRIKLLGYEPIFKEIDIAKKDYKRQGISNSKAQEYLFNFYGDEDPKIVKKIKEGMYESVVNERRRPPKMKKGKREDEVKNVYRMVSSLGSGALDNSKADKDFQKAKKKALSAMDDMLRIASHQL